MNRCRTLSHVLFMWSELAFCVLLMGGHVDADSPGPRLQDHRPDLFGSELVDRGRRRSVTDLCR